MPSHFLRSGVPDAHTTTRQRLISLLDLPKLYRTIDADPAIVGAGVVHIGSDYQVTVLREFVPLCSIRPKRVILREIAEPVMTAGDYAELTANSPRESQLWREASGLATSCAGAVVGFIIAKTGIAAAPFTGGTSLTVTYIAYSATAASALQCANSSWRTTNELINPQLRLGILTQIKDQVGATLAIGSSTFFGNINHIIIALYEELSEYDL